MRAYRLLILVLLFMLSFTLGSVIAQDTEVTEEPEATEVMEDVATQEAPEATEVPTSDDSADGSTYVVQVGDNLFRIALQFGLTTSQLAEANGITNPSLIFVGQRLTIPDGAIEVEVPTETATPEATEDPTSEPEVTETPVATEEPETTPENVTSTSSYTVQAGDTLFRIAVANNTTVATLISLNPSIANQNVIFVGQRINLPDGSGTDTDADNTSSTDNSTSDEALDVDMLTGVEVIMGDDYIANASLATQLGVDWVKLTVDWAQIEPEEGVFNFDDLDLAIDAFEPNFGVILTLTGAPNWARPSATELALEQPTYGPPDDLATFGTFASEVASRYVGRVDAYEIWFQPNNRLSWMTTDVTLRSDGFPDASLSDVRYIDLLEVAFNAINDADDNALVITAGLAPTGNNDFYNSIDNFVFFEALLEQGAINFSDGFGVHIDGYVNAPDATCCTDDSADFADSYHFFFADSLNNFREILDRNGGSDLPLLVTRFGWGTVDGASGDGSDVPYVALNTDAEQATYTADAYVAGNERGDIGIMVLYNLNGCAVGDNASCYYSLIDADGAARTVFSAVATLDLSDE